MDQHLSIIGGGIAGLSIAWYVSQKGYHVTLYDQKEAGLQASTAAAGMLSPTFESTYTEEAYSALFTQCLAHYDSFVSDIEQHSGLKTDYCQSGAHLVAIDADDAKELSRYTAFLQKLDIPIEERTTPDILQAEPLLSGSIHSGVFAPREKSIDPLKLIPALKKALLQKGVTFKDQTQIDALDIKSGTLRGIIVNGTLVHTSSVVIATGAYPLPKEIGHNFSIRPIKGVAFEVRKEKSGFHLNHILKTIHKYPVYCVPRPDGRITIGATLEDKGFDETVSMGSLMELFSGFWRAIPASEFMEFNGAWTGFRPATPNNAPLIGPTAIEGLTLALGYYRHGILIGPYLGKVLANWITQQENHPLIKQFGALK